MHETVSQSVHALVQSSKISLRPLNVHGSALEIARQHGIQVEGIWLVEQALLMVGSRAGVGMKIGQDFAGPPSLGRTVPKPANSNVH